MDFSFKKVALKDLDQALQIIKDGRECLAEAGSSQWQNGTPNVDLLKKDIAKGALYGLYNGDELALIGALLLGADPSYAKIEGQWLTSYPSYLTLHTFSVLKKYRGQGLYKVFFDYLFKFAAENGAPAVRGDTYKLNQTMQHIFLREGFQFCGVIYLVDEVIDNDR